jgi:glycosyltransferase involved in cell wall biosynthesis
MPVRNAGPFLAASVGSILAQTFPDFEFVILDDASTDDSWAQLTAWAARDPRIRLHRSAQPLGLVGSSNAVIARARAPLIARMDADDISHPRRLERQVRLMQARPDAGAAGTLFIGIDGAGRVVRPPDRWRLVVRSHAHPFPHGSAIYRRQAFDEVGGYRETTATAEDNDLFRRMAARWPVLVIAEPLFQYRYHLQSSTVSIGAAPAAPRSERFAGDFMASQAVRLWAGLPARPRPTDAGAPGRQGWLRGAVYTSWGRLHPSSLRAVLRAWIAVRDRIAGVRIKPGGAYEWKRP